jgi:hypothetical protein
MRSRSLQNGLPTVGLDMLPDLRFLICGVLFCFLLFAVTGAGVRLPDARTHVGEMPEVGRPMMQRSMAEAPAQAQFYMMTIARRSDELERLREPQDPVEAAPAPAPLEMAKPEAETEPDLSKPAVMATPTPDGAAPAPDSMTAEDAEAPIQASRVETARNDPPEEAAGQRIAAREPPSAEGDPPVPEGSEPVSRLANVPLPQPRPAFFGFHRRVHLLHRRHRVIVVQRDIPAPSISPPSIPPPSIPAQSVSGQPGPAQGAVVQGWPAANVTASATAAESGRR